MNSNRVFTVAIVACFLLIFWSLSGGLGRAQTEPTPPSPTPNMTATAMAPTPTAEPPVSSEAEKALQYISEREGIAIADLLVVNEHPVTYPLLAKSFQLVTILDLRTGEGQEYTNFKETEIGQYIAFQRWRNNNGGSNRFVYDGYTGSTHNWFNTWLNDSLSLSPGAEYTEGYGTRLQTYFKTNSSSCPCWLSDYRVGDY